MLPTIDRTRRDRDADFGEYAVTRAGDRAFHSHLLNQSIELGACRHQLELVPQAGAVDRDPKNPASWGKVGRNEDCPCGSGKKYKHCHGRYA